MYYFNNIKLLRTQPAMSENSWLVFCSDSRLLYRQTAGSFDYIRENTRQHETCVRRFGKGPISMRRLFRFGNRAAPVRGFKSRDYTRARLLPAPTIRRVR